MKNIEENICIMVVGYQDQSDENGVVLDIVSTIEMAENNDDEYHENHAYVDFIECIEIGDKFIYEEKEYGIGDLYYF